MVVPEETKAKGRPTSVFILPHMQPSWGAGQHSRNQRNRAKMKQIEDSVSEMGMTYR